MVLRGLLLLGAVASTAALAFAQTAGTTGTHATTSANATLNDSQGRRIGQAELQQTPHGVLLRLELEKATPGTHGLHIHETGRCEAPAFTSAGGHFNPTRRQHGFLNSNGPHAGDLPNIEVPPTTRLWVEYLVSSVTLDRGSSSLLDADGSAIVIHSGKDDYASDPAGNAGDRIACGTVVRSGR
jgi:Cu-Zn family superoxide dismutase